MTDTPTHRCQCGARLWSAEQCGKALGTTKPLTAASARKELARAEISEVRGYPADAVLAHAASRPSRGRWGHK